MDQSGLILFVRKTLKCCCISRAPLALSFWHHFVTSCDIMTYCDVTQRHDVMPWCHTIGSGFGICYPKSENPGNIFFWPGDLELWPMNLTTELVQDILSRPVPIPNLIMLRQMFQLWEHQQIHGYMDRTVSITSTADAGGNEMDQSDPTLDKMIQLELTLVRGNGQVPAQ